VTENYLPSIINLNNAELALMHIIEAQKNHIIAPDDATMRALENKIKAQQQILTKALAGFEITFDEGEETKAFEKFQRILGDFLLLNNQVILLSQKNEDDKAQALSVGKAHDVFQETFALMEIMLETNVVGSENAKIAANTAAHTGVMLTLIVSIVATFIIIILAILIANSIAKPILVITEAARKLATDDATLTGIDTTELDKIIVRKDEVGDIGRAYDTLANYFKALSEDFVQVSQGIAVGNLRITPTAEYKGDFVQVKDSLEMALSNLRSVIEDIVQVSQQLAEGGKNVIAKAEYRGDFLQVKNALETAAGKLAEATTNNAAQNWLKTGQAQLNNQMSGEQDIVTLAKNIISSLTNYVEALVGIFYLLKEPESDRQKPYLQVIASHAYTKNEKIPEKFFVGEGLVGQAALEQKTLYRAHTPDEYSPIIQSSLAQAVPRHILIIPFLYENVVKGVIEIGSTQLLSAIQQEFIEQTMPSIGIVINTAESRAQMQVLLEQSQQQAEELQAQSEELQTQQEELQQTNDELETRNRDLGKQKEDIREQNLALKTNQAEIKKAKAAIEMKAKELELASKYKSEFLANMSHELRTPLNSLLILAQLLTDNKPGNLNAKQIEYARTIHSAGSDLLTLINEILDLSKVEAGKIEIQIEEILLANLMKTVEQKFRHVAEDKGLTFHLNLADDIPPALQTDGQRLKQIINNLLSNAFKFTSKGEIKVTANCPFVIPPLIGATKTQLEPNKTIAITVADTGIGIPKDKQQVIFEAFQQADGTTSRSYGGTGLGLSISRQLARLLGGELTLESEEGKGSTFTLYLPIGEPKTNLPTGEPKTKFPPIQSNLVDDNISAPAIAEASTIATVDTNQEKTAIADDRDNLQLGDKSILIIEDDRKFSSILMELAQNKDFKCLIAEDGLTGLQLAEQYKPNAIILDVGLPQLNGWSVMAKLKDNPDTRHIPVHFISAVDQNMEAKMMGAIGYLLKPVSVEQIGKAFKTIERFLTKTEKNLLVVVDNEYHQQKILDLVGGENIQIKTAMTSASACQYMQELTYDCIILDMDIEQGSGSKLLEQMQQKKGPCQIPIIAYADRDLTADEEALLLQCADELPIKSVHSPERLLDEATLFLHQIEANLPANKRKMLRMVHDKTAILRQKKVLIIDDDMRNTFALTTMLEDYDMEVVIGADGKEGLTTLAENDDVAIVLMDIMMPEMDGYEAIRKIRQQPKSRHLPIIALTAKAMKDDRAKCIEAGANDYLAKPVDTNKLLSLMRVWLHR
jgi:signal transduction histidine kinase/DNA-binding response OmpR family regulator/methyl-accepting chemotaxis protein